MSVSDVYHYSTQHLDHHRKHLTLPESSATAALKTLSS
jgi:hypothetical protein